MRHRAGIRWPHGPPGCGTTSNQSKAMDLLILSAFNPKFKYESFDPSSLQSQGDRPHI